MKKIAVAVVMVMTLVSSCWAIDGAAGIGAREMKIEAAAYTSGMVGMQFDYGLSHDWSVFGTVQVMGVPGFGATGFGIGTKYAILNEKRGHGISLAPKLSLLLVGGGVAPEFGIVASKKVHEKVTVVGDISVLTLSYFSNTTVGVGALYNLNERFQLSGMLGISSVVVDYYGYKYVQSGASLGLGVNYLF